MAAPTINKEENNLSAGAVAAVFCGSLIQTAIIYPTAHFFGVFILTLIGAASGRYLALSAYLCILTAFLFFSAIAGYLFPCFAFWRGLASFMWMTAFDAMAAKIFEQPSIYPWQATEIWIICLGTAVGMILCAAACGVGGWARQSLPAWLREEIEEFYESIGLPPPFPNISAEETSDLRARLFALASPRIDEAMIGDGFLTTAYELTLPDENIQRCATELHEIVRHVGWPGIRLVGEDGAAAAWQALQRLVNIPHLQRLMLMRLIEAAARRDVPAWQPAVLEDRIRIFEGRLQLYGTHVIWEAPGNLAPWPIESAESVDKRRHMLGMAPLMQSLAQAQARWTKIHPCCPTLANWKKQMDEWAQQVGWRHAARAADGEEE